MLEEATRVILIRHGETAWNRAARIPGHTDISLSALELRLVGGDPRLQRLDQPGQRGGLEDALGRRLAAQQAQHGVARVAQHDDVGTGLGFEAI